MTATETTALVPAEVDQKAAQVEAEVAEARRLAEALEVKDQAGADNAGALLRAIKRREKESETERTALVKPLNDTVKRINQKFKDAAAPYKEADRIVRGKLTAYQAEQDRIRREEEARLEAERQERERKAREAREAQEAEERRKREQAEADRREAEKIAREARDEEERAQAEEMAEEAKRAAEEAAVAEQAIASLPEVELPKAVVPSAPKQEGVSVRKVWKLKATNVAELPPEFLLANEKALNERMRAGVKADGCPPQIPGAEWEQVDEMAVRG